MYETLTAMANTTTFTELDQLKAMAIVNIFETSRPFGEYGALVVLNDGAGLSYGISQFTHRSGSLHAVVRRYLEMGGRVGRPTLIENVARLRSDSVAAILSAEIVITLRDFMVEDRVRAGFGGVLPGERATHAVMGIVYGAMLAFLVPTLAAWWSQPMALAWDPVAAPEWVRLALWLMSAGVFLSGVRDLGAVYGLRASRWPWETSASS